MINDINSIRDGKTKLKGVFLSDEVKARLQTVAERLRQQQEIRKRQDRLEQKFLEEIRTVSKRVDDTETMLKQQIIQTCREVQESMENEISSATKSLGEQIAQARQDAKESSDKALHEAEHSLGRQINEAKEISENELRGAIDNLENNVAKTRLFMKENLDNSNKGLRRRILWSYVIGCLGLLSSIITLTLSALGIL